MLLFYKKQPNDFHSKSMNGCNENTELNFVKTNLGKSYWSFKVRPQGKPFQVETQPKLNVLKIFIWRPGCHINFTCIFNLLHYYCNSTSSKSS